MDIPLFTVTRDKLDLAILIDAVIRNLDSSTTKAGAATSFLGLVRSENKGKKVLRLEYEAYEPLAIKTFKCIAQEMQHRWPQICFGLHHRIGTVKVGEPSIAIAASGPHRAETFEACRYAIERVKQIVPIWKHEFFVGGDVWIEGSKADPEDELARKEAYRLACR